MADWRIGAARDLRIVSRDGWDGPAAQARLFGDGEEIDQERARKGHLVYDAERPDVRASYKLPFADVVDGELVAVDAGLRAAASRLPQADIPEDVRRRARSVLDAYFRRMEEKASGVMHKTLAVTVEDSGAEGGRIVINTAAVDRDGDRVLPSGVVLDAYMRNPVVQWGHNYREPWATIGRTTKLEATDSGLVAEFELRPPANEQDPQNVVRLLWEGGWVRTASVGFRPLDAEPNDVGGNDFKRWELLEWSLVPVPANQEALRLAVKGLTDATPKALEEQPAPDNEGVERPETGDDIEASAEGASSDETETANTNNDNELTPSEESALLDALEHALQTIANILQSGD